MSAPTQRDPARELAQATLRWFEQHAAQGIIVTDADLRVQTWNAWIAAATGLEDAGVVGRPLFEVLPSLVERGFDQYYADALRGEVKILSQALHRFVLPLTRAGGEPIAQSGRIAPLHDGDRVVGTITIIEDVSERVATERELRARITSSEDARATAETASRVKDEFLATLSHEIRTPLNAVLGWTRILRTREPDPATVRRAIDVIDRNASAQLTLISDMLDIARISAGKIRLDIRDVDLAATAASALDVVRPAADAKGVRLLVDVPASPVIVRGDADRLLQVIWNLLSNAVKFTDRDGVVEVGIQRGGAAAVLSIRDTGAGIEATFLPQVFERFKQADPSAARRHGGLGLGLALVRELVELHGGSVSVTSGGAGKGSLFSVVLPTTVEDGRRAVSSSATGDAAATRSLAGIHVIIIDDDPDSREILLMCLEDAGATITAAASADAALAIVRDRGVDHQPTVIVSDIGMPDRDGYAFLHDLRSLPSNRGGELPVIAVTAYGGPEDRQRALSAGFQAHLPKPFSPETLVALVARLGHVPAIQNLNL